jgi:hypothetical protein
MTLFNYIAEKTYFYKKEILNFGNELCDCISEAKKIQMDDVIKDINFLKAQFNLLKYLFISINKFFNLCTL